MAKEKMRPWVGWNDLTMFGDSGIDHLRRRCLIHRSRRSGRC